MQPTSFQTLTRHVTYEGTPRVWSLLVTVFGELAQDGDTRISTALLRQFTGHLGIKPEAMRVALHRLRKDGWIDSERKGRTSDYFLTEWGRAQTVAATPRIYARRPATGRAWLVLFNPALAMQNDELAGIWVSSNLLLTPIRPDMNDAITTELQADGHVPEWISGKVCDTDTVRRSRDFLAALEALTVSLDRKPDLTAMQTAALRVLLVHCWRRIVLKTPELPDHVFPAGWCGADCRSGMSELLDRLPKQDPADLERRSAVGA